MWFEMFRFYAGGITGMIMIFILFRLLYTSPIIHLPSSITHHPSYFLQYVGKRTLDIYLLHYFFLPRFLMEYAPQLQVYDSRFLEFVVIMTLSIIILLFCLITSYIIRLSPFLGHYLFGVKY